MADGRYKYTYPLILTPLRSDIAIDFKNDTEASEAIDQAVAKYNCAASASRTCPKELVDVKKHRKQIEVTLVSADKIKSPGRALRTLSLQLLKFNCFKSLLTDDRKLFTTAYKKFNDENQNLDNICVSDDVLLKAIVDVIFAARDGTDNPVMAAALHDFKKICVKYHLNEKY